jgi:nucleoid DNA-binding protein
MNTRPPENASKHKALSNKAIIRHINDTTGIPIRDVRQCVHGVIHFIRLKLGEGAFVNLHGLGTFSLKPRTGRVSRGFLHGKAYVRVHPNANYVRFKSSHLLKKYVHANRPPQPQTPAPDQSPVEPGLSEQ